MNIAEPRFIPKKRQKYQNGNIHRKLRVPTSVILPQPKIQYRNRSAIRPHVDFILFDECRADKIGVYLGTCTLWYVYVLFVL